ncbi:uncharacterized protein LOC119672804 isoform X1 [Teleopsis dalmanni]|uniref:uncharacterized protein LOC119672804 isoform X1 n=1 Tax=Teleopsis dalmanni TaxID=139649 RepID=UPI0018CFDACE|nr:uncharacterized protein LOC119672804 isoform X1 [Teleopsis dalmanni]
MSLREPPSPRRYRSPDRNNRTEKGMHRYRDRNAPYYPSYIQHDVRSEHRCKYYDRNNYRSRSRERQYNGNSQWFNNRTTKPSYHRNTRENMPYSRNWDPSSAPPSVPFNENNKNRNNSTSREIAPRCSSTPFKATDSYGFVGTNGTTTASDPNQKANYTKVLKHLVISHLLTQLIPANNITEQHFENFPLKDSDKNVNHANKYVDDHDEGYDADSEDCFDDYFFENLYYSSKLRKEIRKYHDIKKELMEISAEIQIKEKQDRNGGNDNNDINDNKICNETKASTITSES